MFDQDRLVGLGPDCDKAVAASHDLKNLGPDFRRAEWSGWAAGIRLFLTPTT